MWNPNGDFGWCAGSKLLHKVATSRGLDRLRSMAALYGHIGEFVETQEEWRQYAERIQHYFAANGVTDAERKSAIFLSVIGPRAYKLLSSLVAPSKPGEKTYDELVVALTEHHSPAPSEIVQRFKFNSRFRHAGESVATYVAELRSIAQTCNYGTSLDEMLRGRIMCALNDDRIPVVDGNPLTMELDTGAAVSLVLESTYQEYWPDRQLQECQTRLSTYSGEPLNVLGTLEVEVQYEGQRAHLPLC